MFKIYKASHPNADLSQETKIFNNIVDTLPTGNKILIKSILCKYSYNISQLKHPSLNQNILFFLSDIPNNTIIIQLALFFIELGVNPSETDLNGQTCLFYACNKGKIDYVKLLLEKENININHKDYYGQTPIFYAVSKGYIELTTYLISQGAEVNIIDNLGQSCIFYSVLHKQYEVTNLLIQKGADVNIVDKKGYNLIQICIKYKLRKMKRMLIKSGINMNNNVKHKKGLKKIKEKHIKKDKNYDYLIDEILDRKTRQNCNEVNNCNEQYKKEYKQMNCYNERNNDDDSDYVMINNSENLLLRKKRYILVKELIDEESNDKVILPLELNEILQLKEKYPYFRELLYN